MIEVIGWPTVSQAIEKQCCSQSYLSAKWKPSRAPSSLSLLQLGVAPWSLRRRQV